MPIPQVLLIIHKRHSLLVALPADMSHRLQTHDIGVRQRLRVPNPYQGQAAVIPRAPPMAAGTLQPQAVRLTFRNHPMLLGQCRCRVWGVNLGRMRRSSKTSARHFMPNLGCVVLPMRSTLMVLTSSRNEYANWIQFNRQLCLIQKPIWNGWKWLNVGRYEKKELFKEAQYSCKGSVNKIHTEV